VNERVDPRGAKDASNHRTAYVGADELQSRHVGGWIIEIDPENLLDLIILSEEARQTKA
jgi:hypothetical protein